MTNKPPLIDASSKILFKNKPWRRPKIFVSSYIDLNTLLTHLSSYINNSMVVRSKTKTKTAIDKKMLKKQMFTQKTSN